MDEDGNPIPELDEDGNPIVPKPVIPEVPLPPLKFSHPGAGGDPPADVLPMFLTPDCRKNFDIKTPMLPDGKPDEAGFACTFIDKETAYKDIQTNAKLSDWYECKGFIDSVKDPAEGVPGFNVVYDGEEVLGESFYLCGPDQLAKLMANIEAAKVIQQEQWKEAKAALMLELGISESSEEEDPNAPEPEIPDIQPSGEGWKTIDRWQVPPGEDNTGEILRVHELPESAVNVYSREHREQYETENPEEPKKGEPKDAVEYAKQVTKALQKQWEELPEEEKQPYIDAEPPAPESYKKLEVSDVEVEKLTVKDVRPLIQMNLKRKRRYFGGMAMFYDTDAADIEGVEIRKMTMEDPNFKLKRALNDKQVQAVPDVQAGEAQTTFFVKRNAAMQYEPITWPEERREEHIFSDEMREFLTITRDRYEHTLQQNEVVNLFEDPYKEGDDEGLDYAEKTDEDITPQQNFPERNRSVM